jgi:hypothetical protein
MTPTAGTSNLDESSFYFSRLLLKDKEDQNNVFIYMHSICA